MKTKTLIRLFAVWGIVSATSAMAAIGATPHNLNSVLADTSDNGEVCAYCHTPHQANAAFTGAPIWNKATPATAFFMYGASATGTVGSTVANTVVDATPGASSMACLSCHDGVSAVDSILNAPGSGMNTIAGTNILGDTLAQANDASNIGAGAGFVAATTGDLRNDHPISIEYLGDGTATSPASLRATNYTFTTTWLGATTIADVLRPDPADIAVKNRVECGSCHDPHNGSNPANEVNYLRTSNTGSMLCLGCHDK